MIFGVSPMIQDKEVTHWCFKTCKKIRCAGIDGGEIIGSFFPCLEEICEHEDRRSEIMGDVKGDPFCMRKLKPIPKEEE